jgi:hypothetical protein
MSRTKACHRPSGKILALTSTGDVAAVLATECPLRQSDGTSDEVLLFLPQARDVPRRKQVDDGLSDELLASVAEHAAASLVHVGVAAVEIRHENSIGSLLHQILIHVRLDSRASCARLRGTAVTPSTRQTQYRHGGGQNGNDDLNTLRLAEPGHHEIQAGQGLRQWVAPSVSVACHPGRAT